MHASPSRRLSLAFAALLAALAALSLGNRSEAEEPVDSLTSLLSELRKSEALYLNLDVRWRTQYSHLSDLSPFGDTVLKSGSYEGRTVQQGNMHRVEFRGQYVTFGGKVAPVHRVTAFDGAETRSLEDRLTYIANIVDHARYDSNSLDFHMFPLRTRHLCVPLSTWLAGHEATMAHPRGPKRLDSEHVAWLDGRERIEGLECCRIVIEYFRPGSDRTSPTDRRVLWLAIDRNYLPIRAQGYNLFKSSTLPVESTSYQELRELQHGVWYPAQVTHVGYDEQRLSQNDHQAAHRTVHTIKGVSLNPGFEVGFFQEVAFPAGAMVYRVSGEKIVESFRQE